MGGDLREHFASKGSKDKAQRLLILDVPLVVRRIGEDNVVAIFILA
jgi:hypothetical protein